MLRFLTFQSCQHVIRTPVFQEVDQLSPKRMDLIQGIIGVWTKEAYKVGGRRCLQMAAAVRHLLKTWWRSSSAWVQIEHVWSAVKWRLCLSLLVRSLSLRSSYAKEQIRCAMGSFHIKLQILSELFQCNDSRDWYVDFTVKSPLSVRSQCTFIETGERGMRMAAIASRMGEGSRSLNEFHFQLPLQSR